MKKRVYFKNIEEAEALCFIEHSQNSYRHDLIASKKFSSESLINKELKRFRNLFFQGIEKKNGYIYAIMDENNLKIGYIWYEKRQVDSAYICDFVILRQYRSRGYGYASLKCLEEQLKKEGIHLILLHVFDFNYIAINLYKKAGYVIYAYEHGGIRMKKKLEV